MKRLLLILLTASLPAWGQVEIGNAWSRATAPGSTVAAGYMALRNRGAQPDRLLGASSPAASRVELHVHLKEGEVIRMREVKAYDVPAGGRFERAGEIRVEFHVRRLK